MSKENIILQEQLNSAQTTIARLEAQVEQRLQPSDETIQKELKKAMVIHQANQKLQERLKQTQDKLDQL